jgi:hypothetical protein
MVVKILSFLTGVVLSSAWWSLPYMKTADGETEPVCAAIATGLFVGLFVWNCIIHWDDKS